jgi:hypothetical protein
MSFISNNKKRIMGAALMVLFGINAYADTANTDLIIGNNKKSSAGLESVKGATDVGSAIFFDADYMSAYKGCQLMIELFCYIICNSLLHNLESLFALSGFNLHDICASSLASEVCRCALSNSSYESAICCINLS